MATKTGEAFRIGDTLHALLARPSQGAFPSLADTLYDGLWKRIVNLEFPPGTRLSDEALAREMGVSRTPVREALNRLSQVGLVRVEARRGFFVPTVTPEDVAELYDLRTALEVYATRQATPLLTEEDLAPHRERQRQAHERASSAEPGAVDDFYQADLLFHDLIHQRGGNRRSMRILADVMGQLSLLSLRTAQLPHRRLVAIEEHARILDALARRDPAEATAAMEAHIQGVKRRVLEDFL